MKFLFFTDVHAAVKNPGNRKDNYLETVVKKLRNVQRLGDQNNVDFYICGGDLFNTPEVSFTCVSTIADVLKSFKLPIYSVVGSHDHFNYNFNTLKRSALGLLHYTGNIKIVTDWLAIENTTFYFSHHSNLKDNDVNNYKFTDALHNKFNIHVIHGSFFPTPLPGGSVLLKDYPNKFMDLVLTGHIHQPFHVFENGVEFFNPGSLLRVAINELHDPGVVIVDVNDKIVTRRESIFCQPDDVVFNKNKDIIEVNDVDFSQFFSEVAAVQLNTGIGIRDLIISQKENFSEGVLTECLNILETVNGR